MMNPAIPDTGPPRGGALELPLLLDRKELLRLRIRPAEFARLLCVSKQCVSLWIRDGKIGQPSPLDGRIDVQRSIQDVLRNTSPGRLRSRVLRQAVTDALALHENLARAEARAMTAETRAGAAEAALTEARKNIAYLEQWSAGQDEGAEIFKRMIAERAYRLRAMPSEAWPAILGEIELAAIEAADAGAFRGSDDLADFDASTLPDDGLADFLEAATASGAIYEDRGGADALLKLNSDCLSPGNIAPLLVPASSPGYSGDDAPETASGGVQRPRGALVLHPVDGSHLTELATATAIHERYDARSEGYKLCDCPRCVADAYLIRDD